MEESKNTVNIELSHKKIKDFIQLKPYKGVFTIEGLSPEAILQSYIFTEESIENLKIIFDEISKNKGSVKKSIIISGDRGVGKTHTLAVCRELIKKPSLAKLLNVDELKAYIKRLSNKKFIPVSIDCKADDQRSLKELFYYHFNDLCNKELQTSLPPVENWLELDDSDAQIKFINDFIPDDYELVIFVDDISEKLISYKNLTKIISDLEFMLTISLATSIYPIVMVATFFEKLLKPPEYTRKYDDLNQKLTEYQIPKSFISLSVTKDNLKQIVSKHILAKSVVQIQQLKEVYRHIKEGTPYFNHSEDEFIDIYPIHPITFNVSFYLHRHIKNFSLLSFIYSTANKILGHHCTSLATIDLIFDLLEHQIKKIKQLTIALQSFDTIKNKIIPELPVETRLLAKLILKALFILSVTEGAHPSVENIMDALLITEYKGKVIKKEDIVKILDFVESSAPQCIRKLTRKDFIEYQLVTIDHASIDFIIQKLRTEDPTLSDKAERTVFNFFFSLANNLNIKKENYNLPISTSPILFKWRGTIRAGIASWGTTYEQIYVPSFQLREKSILSDITDTAKLNSEQDIEKGTLKKKILDSHSALSGKELHWQLMILSLLDKSHTSHTIKELVKRYPTLIVLKPAEITDDEIQKIEDFTLLISEKNKYQFFDIEEEYETRKKNLEKEIFEIIKKKYITEGILFYNNSSCPLVELDKNSSDILQSVFNVLTEIMETFFPLHPLFEDATVTQEDFTNITEILLNRKIDSKTKVNLVKRILVPLNLVQKTGKGYIFTPENDAFLESQFISEIIYLVGTFPKTVFPISLFHNSLSSSPYGLPKELIDIVLLSLVAARKIKIFQSQKADLEVINEMSLSGEIDLSYFDSVQATEDRVLPLPELFKWGFTLCDTKPDTTKPITESRKNLKHLLQEWLDFEKNNSLHNLIQTIPNDLVTTHLWRELQTAHRNLTAVMNVIENICGEKYSLEDGLSLLASIFSNNYKAFIAVLDEIANIRDFLEWSFFFLDAKMYVLTSEKTDNNAIENLRYNLSTFFERPTRLISKEPREEFHKNFLQFKQAYVWYYKEKHDQQLEWLSPDGHLAKLMESNWWKNLPILSKVTYCPSYHIKYINQLLSFLRDKQCHFQVEKALERSPICICGFRLNGTDNIEKIVNRIIQFSDKAKEDYKNFFDNYKKLIIRELQKIPSIDDEVARQIVNVLNGNFDIPITFDAIRLINIILRKKIKPISIKSIRGEQPYIALPRNHVLQSMTELFKELQESKETFFIMDEEE